MVVTFQNERMQYIIKEVVDSDYNNLAHFLSSFPGDNLSLNKWEKRLYYWWNENPAYTKNLIRGVILLYDENIVGFAGNIPNKMVWNGEEKIVINGTTWRVLPEHRKQSMELWFKHRELTSDYIYFNTTPNEFVKVLLRKLSFYEYRITKYWFYYFGCSQTLIHYPIVNIGIFLFKLLERGIVNSLNLFHRDVVLKNDISPLEEEIIDELWNKHKRDFLFTNVRDSSYIKWIKKTKQVLYVSYKGDIIGYIILHIDDKKKSIMLVDYWSKDLVYLAKPIIINILKKYSNMNVILPSLNIQFEKAAKNLLMIKRKCPKVGFIYNAKCKPIDPDKSFLCMLQGDYGM